MVILHVRAAWEEHFKGHFGKDIIDEFFDLLEKKMVESSILSQSCNKPLIELFFLLKRKIC